MGNVLSMKLSPEEIIRLQESSHCTSFIILYVVSEAEINLLYSRFQFMDRDQSGGLSVEEVMAIPEFAMNPLANRLWPIMLAYDEEQEELVNRRYESDDGIPILRKSPSSSSMSKGKEAPLSMLTMNGKVNASVATVDLRDKELSFPGYVAFLSAFHPKASRREKLLLAFRVFNGAGDDRLRRGELTEHLRSMLGAHHVDQGDLEGIVSKTWEALTAASKSPEEYISFDQFEQVHKAFYPTTCHFSQLAFHFFLL